MAGKPASTHTVYANAVADTASLRNNSILLSVRIGLDDALGYQENDEIGAEYAAMR
jgi:hypothetical protein